MTRKRVRLGMLGIGLAAAMMMRSGDVRVTAQESNRGDDAAVTLAGRKVRIDKSSGKLRELSQQEARELVSTLTAMTTRTERAAATPGGGTLVQMNGFDHVLVGRPDENGKVDVQCVSSVEEAVSFLSQQPKSSEKE
jgi:histidine phosphotransferase